MNVTKWNNFSTRIFLTITILVITGTFLFSAFLFNSQKNTLATRVEDKGEILSALLSYDARLAVFSQNGEMLCAPIHRILRDHDVLSAAVFAANGKLLACRHQKLPDSGAVKLDNDIIQRLSNNPTLFLRQDDNFVCWSRVTLDPIDDGPYFKENSAKDAGQTIGYVEVTMDGRPLHSFLRNLLLSSLSVGVILFLIGSLFAFYLSRMIAKPVNKLAERVRMFSEHGKYDEMPIISKDEIGGLAVDFSNMVESIRKREIESRELQEKLQHSSKMEALGTLAGGVAHDFNNILMAINGYGSMLIDDLHEHCELRPMVESIVKAGDRAASLTQQLVAFSRKQIVTPKPILVDESIRQCAKMFSRLIPVNIDIHLDLASLGDVVVVDPGQFDQILVNLVTNARDAMPGGGGLNISTTIVELEDDFTMQHDQKGGTYVMLTVNDNGTGMPEEVKERIFDPFFTTKDVGKGTGLGLSTVYGIVKQHNGIIDVHSEVGKWTSISIYFPLAELDMAAPQENIPRFFPGNKETILVAEDTLLVMEIIVQILEKNNYNVITAADGLEAVLQFLRHRDTIDILLFDIIMPKLNGKEALNEIRTISPHIKAIFLSGYTSDIATWDDVYSENTPMIAKPVRPEDLLARLRMVLDS